MIFASRLDAGERLGRHLVEREMTADLVLGLPRGGVVVGAAVAQVLRRPLDVIVVRKIGHPRHREFAVGALAEPGVVILDEEAIARLGVVESELRAVIEEETSRLQDYRARFHRSDPPLLQDRPVLIVDDGLATGATMEAAVLSAKEQRAARVVVAAPVASESAVARLRRVADAVVVPFVDPAFQAVGGYYANFTQTTDEEVLAVLASQRG